MDGNNLLVSVRDGRGRVTLNRPEKRNAMSLELLREFDEVLQQLGADPSVQVVIIDGAGPVFSAGHDLGEMIDRERSFYEELFAICTDVMLRIQTVPQPVIAQVHGLATAAGCQLVAACDLAVADENCRFATPGVTIGLFCSTPMVPISRAIGRKRALAMLFTGDPIDATTAQAWGLINTAVPGADLEDEVLRLAGRIQQFSRDVVALGKSTFYSQVDESQADAYSTTVPVMSRNAAHQNAQEGMAAFLDKRAPVWNDR